MDDGPVVRRAVESWREDILTAAGGWCAPSETRFDMFIVHAVDVPTRWVESPEDRREREIRRRWAEEDEWLDAQLALARTVPEEITWPGLVL